MEKINKIFIINLEKDKDRFLTSITELNKYNLTNYEFIKAIEGNKLSNDEYKSYTTSIGYYITSPSMVGCGMSHIKTWKKIVENNIEYSLILEDDFNFKNNFINDLNELMRNTPKNFDILFLNKNFFTNKYLKLCDINDYVYKPLISFETIAYIITLEGAKKILNYINKVAYHIDFQITINHLYYNKQINIISAKKELIYQKFDTSNNIYNYNFPFIIDKLLDNYLLNYIYKVVLLSIFNIKINLNFILILILGYYLFPYAFLLLILEYFIIEKNNNLLSNFMILYLANLFKVLK